jgi:hypothetical protein
MDIRVSNSRTTGGEIVDAVSFFGVRIEAFGLMALSYFLMKVGGLPALMVPVGDLICFSAAILFGVFINKIVVRYPPQFIPYWVSNKSGELYHRNTLNGLFKPLLRFFADQWKGARLPMAPTLNGQHYP